MVETLRFKREVLAVATVLVLGSLFIIYPFLDAILFGIATAFLLRISHNWLNNHIDNELLSSIIIITGVMGFVSIGLYLFINNFFEILTGLNSLTGSIQQATLNVIEILQLSESFKQNIVDFINQLSSMITDRMISIFAGIPALMVHMGIFMVTAIYLYKDGGKVESKLFEIVNKLPDEEEKIARSLIDSMDYIFRGVFVTQFLVALILGLIAGVGFYIISLVTSPMPLIPVWMLLIGLSALLPLIANFMIYVPLGIFYIIDGAALKGSLIIVFGLLVLQVLPEVFLRPYIGSKKMDVHPLLIFTSFIAGPLTLGLKGIILGPLIIILTKEFVLNYTSMVSEG